MAQYERAEVLRRARGVGASSTAGVHLEKVVGMSLELRLISLVAVSCCGSEQANATEGDVVDTEVRELLRSLNRAVVGDSGCEMNV